LHPNATVPEQLQGSVERFGFFDRQKRIRGDACPECGTAIDGIGMSGA
jgi:hypothetical protein